MTIEEFAASIEGPTGADESQIAAFEALVGHRLPEDYRKFLALSGGGWGPCFDFVKDGMEELIGDVLGLRDDGYSSLVAAVRMPDFALPLDTFRIADDAGGNPIILSVREDRFGEILFVDHEVCPYADEARPTIEAAETAGFVPFALAPSFSSLVAHLAVTPDDDPTSEDD